MKVADRPTSDVAHCAPLQSLVGACSSVNSGRRARAAGTSARTPSHPHPGQKKRTGGNLQRPHFPGGPVASSRDTLPQQALRRVEFPYQVIVFRIVVAVLPQLLLLLLEGGRRLLGGWNHTDSAFGVLMVLFLLTPVATAALLVVEILRYRTHIRQESGTHSFRSFRMVAVAIVFFLESLAVDLLILRNCKCTR